MALASGAVLCASHFGLWSIGTDEAWGFATGGVCVWLVVREHVANWPIGLVNNVVFFVLFLRARLFADMGLQVVYFGLGLYGWWNWLHGDRGTRLTIRSTTRREWTGLALALPAGIWALHEVLLALHGAAPFWDALTTALSLAAQFLLCRKRLENWFFWIAADAIYVPLYVARGLPLTALLYFVFLLMCLCGLRAWWPRCARHGGPA